MHNAAIQAEHLAVTREGMPILQDLTFTIAPGRITGLIGPSGSGKTTLMRTIIGAQQISGGKLTVLGLPAGHKNLRPKIGYVTQSPAVYADLTVAENLRYFGTIVGASKAGMQETLKQVDLLKQAGQIASTLSGGQRARLSLAIALVGNAELLVLDEPTVGLDPVLRRDLWALFAQLAGEGRTLLISSHVMDEAEQCDDLLLLRDGLLLSHTTRQALLKETGKHRVEEAFLALVEGKHS